MAQSPKRLALGCKQRLLPRSHPRSRLLKQARIVKRLQELPRCIRRRPSLRLAQQLEQSPVRAEHPEVVEALAPRAQQPHQRFHVLGFVVATLSLANMHVLTHRLRHPKHRAADAAMSSMAATLASLRSARCRPHRFQRERQPRSGVRSTRCCGRAPLGSRRFAPLALERTILRLAVELVVERQNPLRPLVRPSRLAS